jgi:tetratricopeptide (TPR) repeat protein
MKLKDFSGASRIPLIGRRAFLQDAERRIRQGGTHLLHFEGQGGIGKTAVLEAILERSRSSEGAAAHIAAEVIDLYHVDVHTPEGLIGRIMQVIGRPAFPRTASVVEALDQARSVGNMDVANEKAREVRPVFMAEFAGLADEGIVLAFDTLEVLEYERDPFQAELGEEIPILSTGEWLVKSFLPSLQGNVLLLLAGRPNGVRERLDALRRRSPHLQLRHVHLEALSEDETQEYLKAVAQVEGKWGDGDAAARLWQFSEERGDVVHLLTGGRPILLALVADMLAHGWTLPPSFGRSAAELRQGGARTWWPDMEMALVVRIQESPTPIGETIRALAWLRKGATPGLLARVMDLTTRSGGWDTKAAESFLGHVARLTLVKVRPNEGRVFLHDEMYALLEKYVLRASGEEERTRVYNAILDYYNDLTDDLERRVAGSSLASPLIHARLRHAYVENMHYRLTFRPSEGFAMFFWLAEEALAGRDVEMDMLLRSELLRTVGLLQGYGPLPGLDPREVEIDTAVRWGVRMLFFRNDPDRALEILDRIRKGRSKDAESLELTWMHLQLYLAAARIERAREGDWPAARELLRRIEERTDDILNGSAQASTTKVPFWGARAPESSASAAGSAESAAPTEADRRWRARTLKAAALNYDGHLDRQQGRYAAAVQHYQAATMLQRRLGMASLAPTLTALSHTMVLMGQFHHARLLAQEAERWARHSGKDYVLALALNARALVEEYDGRPRDALQYTEQALKIAEGLRASRVRGLIYLTRARAHRHLFLTGKEQDHDPPILEEALKEVNQAVNLLKNTPPDRVTALIERGCMHREIARGHYLQHSRAEAVKAVRKSQEDLKRAAILARALDLPDPQALAWTNLGWLWYYTGQVEEAHEALQQTYSCIPGDYLFPARGPLPPMAQGERKREASLPLWNTLGKAEMLKAYIALDQARAAPDEAGREEKLKEAVRHITLSLAYNEQIAGEYSVTRAEEDLHKRILQDNLGIGRLHVYTEQVAAEQGLGQPTRFQQFLVRMFGPVDLWV